MEGVGSASGVGMSEGRHRIQVETHLDDDIRPRLAQTIVESGWRLFEMQSFRMSLEDIFIKLTTSDTETSSVEVSVEVSKGRAQDGSDRDILPEMGSDDDEAEA